MTKQFITAEGLKKLKEELDYLKMTKRQDIAKRIQAAKELGDLSENAEYSEAKEQQALNEVKIAEMEETFKNAETIDNRHSESDIIQIGSTIRAKNEKAERVFTIVGSSEADPVEGKISNESPLAMFFLGHRVGDNVKVETPKGKVEYEIVEVK